MKLAEALQERADLNTKIEELRNRLSANALVQEGESPAEDPNELLKELNHSLSRLEELIASINLTNSVTMLDGKSVTERIAERDMLKLKAEIYRNLIYTASRSTDRARNSEIRILSTVSVKDLQKEADALSKQLREADNAIQALNWTTELK